MNVQSNQDIQATYHMMTLLERSKAKSYEVVDRIPNVCAVIDSNGRILRGNTLLQRLLGRDSETIMNSEFGALFTEENWAHFCGQVNRLRDESLDQIDFELPVCPITDFEVADKEARPFLWRVSTYVIESNWLILIIGADISQLRTAERLLQEVFSSVSLGMMLINSDGLIEAPYSKYSENLLGTEFIAGKTMGQLLFGLGQEAEGGYADLGSFDVQNSDSDRLVNRTLTEFEEAVQHWPKEIEYVTPYSHHTRVIGIKVHPIIHNNLVKKLFLILDDRSAHDKLRQIEEADQLLEEQRNRRIAQIKSCSPEVLSFVMDELLAIRDHLIRSVESRDISAVAQSLFRAKAQAKTASFERLVSVTNAVERTVSQAMVAGAESTDDVWISLDSDIHPILSEVAELFSLYKIMTGSTKSNAAPTMRADYVHALGRKIELARFNELLAEYKLGLTGKKNFSFHLTLDRMQLAIKALEFIDLDDLRESITKKAFETSVEYERKLEFGFHSEKLLIPRSSRDAIVEISRCFVRELARLSIERPEARVAKGKKANAKVQFKVRRVRNKIYFDVSDDGAGIKVQSVLANAVRCKLVSLDQGLNMQPNETLQLVFSDQYTEANRPGLKFQKEEELPFVRKLIEDLGGNATLRSTEAGAAFQFSLQDAACVRFEPQCSLKDKFAANLQGMLQDAATDSGYKLEFVDPDESLSPQSVGLVYSDCSNVALAASTVLGAFGQGAGLSASLVIVGDEGIDLVARRSTAVESWPHKLEYELAGPFCSSYFATNLVAVVESADEIRLRVGTLISPSMIPTVHAHLVEGVGAGAGAGGDASAAGDVGEGGGGSVDKESTAKLLSERAFKMGIHLDFLTESPQGVYELECTIDISAGLAVADEADKRLLKVVNDFLGRA